MNTTSGDDLPHEINASTAGQIAQLVQTGLPIETGLRALAEQTSSPKTRSSLLEISRRLEQGLPLQEALQGPAVEMPATLKALVEAGIETGRLDLVMQYGLEQQQRSMNLRQEIWLVISYPLFLFWFSMLYCGAFLTLIVPQFKKIFDDFGTEMPRLTQFILGISDMLRNIGIDQTACAVILLVGFVVTLTAILAGFSKWMQSHATSIPLLGQIFQFAALSDFCQLFSLLIESRLPFTQALQAAGNVSDDRWLSSKCHTVCAQIEHGSAPETSARDAELPSALVQVFRNSNSQTQLVEALRGLSQIYTARSSLTAGMFNKFIGPLTVVGTAMFVGITVLALFMPLIKLLNDLS